MNKPVLLKRKLAKCTKVFELFSTIITDNFSSFLKDFFSLIKIFGLTFIRKLYMIAHSWTKNNRKRKEDFLQSFTIINSILWNLNTFLMIKSRQFACVRIKKSTDCGKLKVICSHFSLKMSRGRHEKANKNRDLIS